MKLIKKRKKISAKMLELEKMLGIYFVISKVILQADELLENLID